MTERKGERAIGVKFNSLGFVFLCARLSCVALWHGQVQETKAPEPTVKAGKTTLRSEGARFLTVGVGDRWWQGTNGTAVEELPCRVGRKAGDGEWIALQESQVELEKKADSLPEKALIRVSDQRRRHLASGCQ